MKIDLLELAVGAALGFAGYKLYQKHKAAAATPTTGTATPMSAMLPATSQADAPVIIDNYYYPDWGWGYPVWGWGGRGGGGGHHHGGGGHGGGHHH